MISKIPVSSLEKEGLMQVAKWTKIPVLLDEEEMKELFETLLPFHLVCVSAPALLGQEEIPMQEFLQGYQEYVQALKGGALPKQTFRPLFSCALSKTLSSFFAIEVGKERLLIKPRLPVIQLQAHSFFYSTFDKQFHSMVQGEESISWGIQFSYPQLFQDPVTKKIAKVSERDLENTDLFFLLQKWIRSSTLPTPFVVDGCKTNSQIRIGKRGLDWVNTHPQLKAKSITVSLK